MFIDVDMIYLYEQYRLLVGCFSLIGQKYFYVVVVSHRTCHS